MGWATTKAYQIVNAEDVYGTDLKFPPQPDSTGDFRLVTGHKNIEEWLPDIISQAVFLCVFILDSP